MLNESSSFRTVKNGKLVVFKVSCYDINRAIEAKDLKERPLEEIVPKHIMSSFPCLASYWQIDYHHIDPVLITRYP